MQRQYKDSFYERHIGIDAKDTQTLLKGFNEQSLDEFTKKVLPDELKNKKFEDFKAQSESEFLESLKTIAKKNKVFKNFIGQGYFESITPPVITRNILENPVWYTSYTPYQAEISQGRLEALLNFQSLVSSLTGFELANASLLDEATAGAEAVNFLKELHPDSSLKKVLLDKNLYPQNLNVIQTRAEALGLEVKVQDLEKASDQDMEKAFAAVLQYPDRMGNIKDISKTVSTLKQKNILVALSTDLLALTLLKAPAELGADVAFGSSGRFGVPLFFGGPLAGFFASKKNSIDLFLEDS